jgi:radical SAM protein with 4Fe4S-binding SPASM domain
MENNTIASKKFVLFPGVFKVQGIKRTAYINIIRSEIFVKENSKIFTEKNSNHIAELENRLLGMQIDKNYWEYFQLHDILNVKNFDALTVSIQERVDYIKYINYPIRKVRIYTKKIVSLRNIKKQLQEYGYSGECEVIIQKGSQCNLKYSKGKPRINPLYYYFNSKFNPCWGKSIAIDIFGNVKPCLWYNNVVGNIEVDQFEEIVKKLTEMYWKLNKDRIEKCCDCELRYVCSDCRVEAEKKGGVITSQTAYCPYLK